MASTWEAYYYSPSLVAAIFFASIFLLITALHLFHVIRTRTLFLIPFIVGGTLETIGYIGRAISAKQTPNWALAPYVIQSTLLLVAPAFFAASIYMELGRIIKLVQGERHSLISVNAMTKIFVAGDILSFLTQASGAGILATSHSATNKTGEYVIVGGLILQVIFFGFFLIGAVVFQFRIGRRPTTESSSADIPWRKHMAAVHVTSLFILVRSIFRVVEYLQGQDGYLLTTEVFLYVFDAALMFLVMAVFAAIQPSEINCLLGKGNMMTTKGGFALSRINVSL